MTKEIASDLQFLPSGTITTALNISKKELLSYEKELSVTPKTIKGKPYYSFDDLEKLKQKIK
jgi:DNA-binding transcriptional MerR regulator